MAQGLYEAEVRTAAFHNGYFAALCNRAGVEDGLTFAGESFITDPDSRVIARGKRLEENLVVADLDLAQCEQSSAVVSSSATGAPSLWPDPGFTLMICPVTEPPRGHRPTVTVTSCD